MNGYLIPFAVARDLFRGKVRDAILKNLATGKLRLPVDLTPQRVKNLLNKLGRKKWNIRVCERYSHGNGVLNYLARYLRGGPISNKRIIKIEDGHVTFNYGREKAKYMKLSIIDFIGRYLQHVPYSNAINVRAYGLYANSKQDELLKCRLILGQNPVEKAERSKWQDRFEKTDKNPGLCPVCNKRLIISSVIQPERKGDLRINAPPSAKTSCS